MNLFTNTHREEYLNKLVKNPPDLIIIGGGITGAGILLDASSRGIHSALFEMQDFAQGTSSRSTKLIHGGLRYLKNLEIGLVREVGRERAIVHKNAPHITYPEPMLLPIIHGGSIGFFGSVFGMWLYDILAGVKKSEQRRLIRKETTMALEPFLNESLIKSGVYYYEYRSDDARLTIEIIKEAIERGSSAINYCKVIEFSYDATSKINGVVILDQLTNKTYSITCKIAVNACGPFADITDNLDSSSQKDKLFITKGVHIVVDASTFPIGQSMYMDTPDGRMIFIIPRDGKVYIGTTDTPYHGDIQHPEVTTEDINYLIEATKLLFPSIPLKITDVESAWAGLRPLIKQKNKTKPGEISRKDELFQYNSGLITITGGKLTGYRKMAERTVNLVCKELTKYTSTQYPACSTDKISLSGGHLGSNCPDIFYFIKQKETEYKNTGIKSIFINRWGLKYGSNIDKILHYYKYATNINTFGLGQEEYAELLYCINHEMVVKPDDYIIRRTSDYYFQINHVRNRIDSILEAMNSILQWDISVYENYKKEIYFLLNNPFEKKV